ncbi:MAG: hypothetical protein LBP22_00475 [Deltaproteobacteria bacterium]|jgi:hypothetical protein|nr:hypothetical protein [Deltaproteobacteria bacterium]
MLNTFRPEFVDDIQKFRVKDIVEFNILRYEIPSLHSLETLETQTTIESVTFGVDKDNKYRIIPDIPANYDDIRIPLNMERTAGLSSIFIRNMAMKHQSATGQSLADSVKKKILSPAEEFKVRARELGLILEGEPIMDGRIQKVKVDGDNFRNQKSGSYQVDSEDRTNGRIRNFKNGKKTDWAYSGQILNRPAIDSGMRNDELRAGTDLKTGNVEENSAERLSNLKKSPSKVPMAR